MINIPLVYAIIILLLILLLWAICCGLSAYEKRNVNEGYFDSIRISISSINSHLLSKEKQTEDETQNLIRKLEHLVDRMEKANERLEKNNERLNRLLTLLSMLKTIEKL